MFERHAEVILKKHCISVVKHVFQTSEPTPQCDGFKLVVSSVLGKFVFMFWHPFGGQPWATLLGDFRIILE